MPGRWLTLETPLGDDVLIPVAMTGTEGISKLYRFDVTAQAKSDVEVTAENLLTKSVTIGLVKPGVATRLVNGIVTSLSAGPKSGGEYSSYQLTIAPTLSTFGLQSGYCVYQLKSVRDIAEAVFSANSFTAFRFEIAKTHDPRDYCVQYGETTLDFLLRLFAEEGMYFFFEHERTKHTLVISDNADIYQDAVESQAEYRPGDAAAGACVYAFETSTSLIPTKWEMHDYNFLTPSSLPDGKADLSGSPGTDAKWANHVYGVTSPDSAGLKAATMGRLANVRADASEAGLEVATATSSCASFTPGFKFELVAAGGDASIGKYVLTDIRHQAQHDTNTVGEGGAPEYFNTFTCIPVKRMALPPPPKQKPFIRGPQTAIVVGPAGDEIHTDEHGRIRVQFYWDMDGKNDDKSSCYIRVAQSWASKGWGAVFLPRIGMEVVVQFLDGDPDRPLVTGAVYNATNVPPWALPDNKEQSGIMTRSTPQGTAENANWLIFTDTKGSEKVDVQAEKDFLRTVKNDDTLDVKHDQIRTIKNDRTTTISEGNETFTIEKGNRVMTIKTGNETLTVEQGNRTESIQTGNDVLTVAKGARTVTLDKGDHTLKLTAGNQVTVLDAGNQTVTLTAGDQATTLKAGNLTTSLTAGDLKLTCTAGKVAIEALGGITLTCGPSKIELSPDGITISGAQVTAKGTAKAEIAGPIVNVSGDGMTNIKGGIVKIN
jgi:type VI secretion system secreted protein VgrG